MVCENLLDDMFALVSMAKLSLLEYSIENKEV